MEEKPDQGHTLDRGAEEFGDLLIAVYEEWIQRDVGKVFVMNFECALNAFGSSGSDRVLWLWTMAWPAP